MNRYLEAETTVKILGKLIIDEFPFVDNMQPVSCNPLTAYLNKTWLPQLSYIGAGN